MKLHTFVALVAIFLLIPQNDAYLDPYIQKIIRKINDFKSQQPEDLAFPEPLKNLPSFIQSNPNLILEASINKSGQCYQEWETVLSYSPGDVFKFWDSYAIPGTGLLAGHTIYPGQFEECINSKTGYSAITFTDFPDTDAYGAVFALSYYSSTYFIVGVCMPASCSNEEVAVLFKDLVNENKLEPPYHVSALGRNKFEATAGFVIACVVFGILGMLVLCATAYTVSTTIIEKVKATNDCRDPDSNETLSVQEPTEKTEQANRSEKPFILRLLLCFDFYTNFCKIMRVPKQVSPDQLPCLNGIRVMSLGWVIIGHTLLLQLSVSDNVVYTIQRSSNFLFQTLANATPSVDTFFVMSGMLVMLGGMRSLDKLKDAKPTKFWIMFYVHRLIRLWPTMLLTILFLAGIYPNLAPLFYSVFYQNTDDTSIAKLCQGSNWLSAALFYSNMVSDPSTACVGWTWYVSNDIQFYIISPVFIVLARVPRYGRLMSTGAINLLILGSTLIILLGSGLNEAPPADNGLPALANPNMFNDFNFYSSWPNKLYFANYCRFPTYGIGLLLGLAAYDKDWIKEKLEALGLKKVVLINTVWALGFAMGIVSLYGVTFYAQGGTMGLWAAAFYNATFRLLWGIFVAIVIFLCITGYGGVLNDILACDFWTPLARVNYTTYIIHFVLLEMYIQTLEQDFHFSTISYTLICCGLLMSINFLSVICSCFLEAPFLALEKLLFAR